MDSSLPGSSVHGIFQARILKQVAISYSKGSSQSRDQTHVSCVSCIGRWILYHFTTWEKYEHQMANRHTKRCSTSLTVRKMQIKTTIKCFPGGSDGKASVCNAGDPGSIPGLGRSPGEGNGSPLQYSCLENPMHGRAW